MAVWITSVLSALAGGWLSHALHLRNSTARKADAILGQTPGTSQSLLDAAGRSAEAIVADAVSNLAAKAGVKP